MKIQCKMSITINDLDEYSLETIFRALNVLDLRACSCVCLRWFFITRWLAKDQLVLSYATPSFRVTNSSKISQIINHQRSLHYATNESAKKSAKESNDPVPKSSGIIKESARVYRVWPIPIRISDSRTLSLRNKNLLRTIKTLIFCGNGYFEPDSSFSLGLLPNLIHLEIRDHQFCQFLIRSFLLQRFFCPEVRYLVLESVTADLLIAFPNLIYLEADHLCGFRYLHNFEGSLNKLKHFILNCDTFNPFIDFFMANCGQLEFINVKLAVKLAANQARAVDLMALPYLLNDFLALKELDVHFEPTPRHSRQLANLLADDFLGDFLIKRTVKIVVHGIILPEFQSHEQKVDYLNSLDTFVRPHPFCTIEGDHLNETVDKNEISGYRNVSRSDKKISTNTIESADKLDIRGVHIDGLLKQLDLKPFKKLNQLLIYGFTNDYNDLTSRLDTIRLMRSLPSTVNFVRLQFNHPIGQAVLDLLPVCFPHLQSLDLIDLGNVAYELKFLYALTYLASLRLHCILIEDVQPLLAAIANCRYLTQLFLVTNPRASTSLHSQLRQALKMKSNQMKINFLLNGMDGLQESNSCIERLI